MFYYRSEESWATFYDPHHGPVFKPEFANPELEMAAMELCKDDPFCLFDVAATSNLDLGLTTLQSSQLIEDIASLSVPSKC